MAAISWTDVTNHAAELSSVSSGAQSDILAYVNTVLVPGEFGGEESPTLKLARIYLAAHKATTGPASGGAAAAGPVLSEKAGELSRTYALIQATQGEFSGSSYGSIFMDLIRRSPARAARLL